MPDYQVHHVFINEYNEDTPSAFLAKVLCTKTRSLTGRQVDDNPNLLLFPRPASRVSWLGSAMTRRAL